MIATPRQRAATAFAIIDRHHDLQTSPCPLIAYTQLAAAMDDEFGVLPVETNLERYGRIRRAEANMGPRE